MAVATRSRSLADFVAWMGASPDVLLYSIVSLNGNQRFHTLFARPMHDPQPYERYIQSTRSKITYFLTPLQ